MEPTEQPIDDNDIHPYETPYSVSVEEGAPGLQKKRAHLMKEAIEVSKVDAKKDKSIKLTDLEKRLLQLKPLH